MTQLLPKNHYNLLKSSQKFNLLSQLPRSLQVFSQPQSHLQSKKSQKSFFWKDPDPKA